MIQRVTIRDKRDGVLLFEIKYLKSGIIARCIKGWEDKVDLDIRNEQKEKIWFGKWEDEA